MDRTAGGPDRPAPSVGESARRTVEAARETGETLLGHAQDLAGTVTEQASDRVEQGKEEVADRLAGVAERVQKTAADLKGDEAWLADLLDRGAGQIAALADSLKERDMRSLLGSVERFARAQPGLFAGAAVAVGFAAARVAMTPATARGEGDRQAAPGLMPHGSEDWLRPGPSAMRDEPPSPYPLGEDRVVPPGEERMSDRRDALSGIPGRDDIAGPRPVGTPVGGEVR
ncbi:MAG: hypothetical protein U1E14_19590 [Geminicoccaceae bacterium]